MIISGLNVNAQAIADGIYAMICERGEEAVVAFGMIPKWAIDTFEKQLRSKLIEMEAQRMKVGVEDIAPYINEDKVKAIVAPIVRAVSSGIYQAASNAGKMVA